MKRNLILFCIITLMASCTETNRNAAEMRTQFLQDSTRLMDSIIKAEPVTIERTAKESFMDTTGIHKAPVRVINAIMFKEEYSNYYSIKLTYKNVTNKKIQGIRFEWFGENTFGEPAEMGSYEDRGYGTGFMDYTINPGKTTSSTWNILSRDGKKVIGARTYAVAFSDGSKWERE